MAQITTETQAPQHSFQVWTGAAASVSYRVLDRGKDNSAGSSMTAKASTTKTKKGTAGKSVANWSKKQ